MRVNNFSNVVVCQLPSAFKF